MKESMKDYKYPQGVAPSDKIEGGIDDKKQRKKIRGNNKLFPTKKKKKNMKPSMFEK